MFLRFLSLLVLGASVLPSAYFHRANDLHRATQSVPRQAGQLLYPAGVDLLTRTPYRNRDMVGTPAPPAPQSTQTPTASTATATAVSTGLTSIPIEVPSLDLLPRVVPGKTQKTVVRSRRNTEVVVQIRYPNGDIQVATKVTDSNGQATYQYKQRSSKISRYGREASVQVVAGSGPAVRGAHATYRILLGQIDLVVAPRVQALGRLVNLWVHSRANSLVVLHVTEGAEVLDSVKLRTGATGWTHKLYRVGQGGRLPRGQQVRIEAVVAHTPSSWTTYTSLIVQ